MFIPLSGFGCFQNCAVGFSCGGGGRDETSVGVGVGTLSRVEMHGSRWLTVKELPDDRGIKFI